VELASVAAVSCLIEPFLSSAMRSFGFGGPARWLSTGDQRGPLLVCQVELDAVLRLRLAILSCIERISCRSPKSVGCAVAPDAGQRRPTPGCDVADEKQLTRPHRRSLRIGRCLRGCARECRARNSCGPKPRQMRFTQRFRDCITMTVGVSSLGVSSSQFREPALLRGHEGVTTHRLNTPADAGEHHAKRAGIHG